MGRLAQPRASGGDQEWAPEVRMAELALCLELLAEQADLVLEEVSWPARREALGSVPEPVAEATPEAVDQAGQRFAFGVTLDQIDTLDRVIQTISAHGDVVAAGHAAELAAGTLPLLGQAIHDGAKAVRDILDQVEAQRLGPEHGPETGVGEKRGMYGAGLARLVAGSRPRPIWQVPAGPSMEPARPTRH